MSLREVLDHAASGGYWHHVPLSGRHASVEFTSPFGDDNSGDNGFVCHSVHLVSAERPEITIAYSIDAQDNLEWMTPGDPSMP